MHNTPKPQSPNTDNKRARQASGSHKSQSHRLSIVLHDGEATSSEVVKTSASKIHGPKNGKDSGTKAASPDDVKSTAFCAP